jgi:hypothetical protein
VVDGATGQPIPIVFVTLLAGGDSIAVGRLSDSNGEFLLQAPAPGGYRLRAEVIGYRTHTSAALSLSRGQILRYELALEIEPVALPALEVRAEEARCRRGPNAGPATARLWEEALKSLRVLAWETRESTLRYRVVRYERRLDPNSYQPEEELSRQRSEVTASRVFYSAPPAELAYLGYIRQRPDGSFDYFAPDAHAVLSPMFIDTHCFSALEGQGANAGLIGLGFRPLPGREPPDVEGVLWLDRETGELRFLEYRYVHGYWEASAVVLDAQQAGGRVEFERLPGGRWIVRRWWIRAPEFEAREFLRGRERPLLVLLRVREEGGEVEEVLTAGGGR